MRALALFLVTLSGCSAPKVQFSVEGSVDQGWWQAAPKYQAIDELIPYLNANLPPPRLGSPPEAQAPVAWRLSQEFTNEPLMRQCTPSQPS